jgi:replication factor C subunit 1
MSNWTDKYKPKTIPEIICNKGPVKALENWFHKFETVRKDMNKKKHTKNTKQKIETKSSVLITGGHGVGKTLAVEVVLKAFNYETHNFDFSDTKATDLKENINKVVNSLNIMNMINGTEQKKIAIVIDEIESITSTTEKANILTLQKLNETYWYCPIIFVSNNQHNKLLSEIKKNAVELAFSNPYDSDLRKILVMITKAEKIGIKNDIIVEKILDQTQHDIRRLINILQDLKYAYGSDTITTEMMDEYCYMSKKKDVDTDLFNATNRLLYSYSSVDDCLRLYETEKVILPLMVHQNYARKILATDTTTANKHEMLTSVADSLSAGDVVENNIYNDQNWDMQEIHGFFTCVNSSYQLCKNQYSQKEIKLNFTTDLNKTSIQKINKKNIMNTNRCLNNMTIFDYIYINKIVRKLIDNGNIKQCVDLLKDYNIKLDHIESLLKIDKIKNTKTVLSSKQKKEFSKYLEKNI